MSSISEALIRTILDSRGNPTVEVEIAADGVVGRAAAPSGASTGVHEVAAFPAGGVDAAIRAFADRIRGPLTGRDVADQKGIDGLLHTLDPSPKFTAIGGNVAVAVSIACARAAAGVRGVPLFQYLARGRPRIPFPMGNVIGGGRHAIGGTTIQEFLAVAEAPSAAAAVSANAEVHRAVRDRLAALLPGTALGRGDEGAWVAPLEDERALDIVRDACRAVSISRGHAVLPAVDFAASEFFRDTRYHYGKRALTAGEQIEFVAELASRFSLYSVEDPLDQDDFDGWAELTDRVGERCMVIGDDIFATSVARLQRGIEAGAANAILIKPNQIGTLTDTEAAVEVAHRNGYRTVMSHRSGETTDDAIAHLAVAYGCVAIKTGVVGGERVAKLNELIRIEEQIAEA